MGQKNLPMKLCTVMGEGLDKIIIYFWNLPAYYTGVMGQGIGRMYHVTLEWART
jgi:hypothetical protein